MFSFALPWLLLLIPLPVPMRYLVPAATQTKARALKIPFYKDIVDIAQQTYGQRLIATGLRRWLVYFMWLLLVIAAAGPQWLGKPVNLPQTGRNIMLAIDLSGSMQIPDMSLEGRRVNRLAVVKNVAQQFIKQRVGDRVGLILFGSRAYLQTPLTFDRKTAESMLNDATIGLAGAQTAIGDAIGLAIKRLSKQPQGSRVLILLTDGVNNAGAVAPIEAAKLAAKNHIKIYTIGIGADRMLVPSIFGAQAVNPSRDLDTKTLQQMADISGGLFFRAKNTQALRQIYQRLNQLEPVSTQKSTFRPITPLYPWSLALALLLSVYLASRKIYWRKFYKSSDTTHTGQEQPES